MNKLFFAIALLCITNSGFAQDESSKTLVKSMDPKETSVINFDFRNKGIESGPWDEGFIRVELEVTANFPEAVLAQLVKAGRYSLSSSVEGDIFNILAKNLDKTVTIGGKDLDDHVRVIIQTPGYYAINEGRLQKSFTGDLVGEIVGRAASKEEAEKIISGMRKIKEQINFTIRFVYNKNKDKTGNENEGKATATRPQLNDQEGSGLRNSGFIGGKKDKLNSDSSLKDVQSRYGDIIMGGMPLDDFND
jgi:hypothetical protein